MSARVRTLALPAVLLLALTGCSSDGTSEDAKPYVDAMVSSLSEDENMPFDEEQATCFAEEFVDVVGIDTIKDAGTPEELAGKGDLDFTELDLSRDQGEDIYDAFDGCGIDLRDQVLSGFEGDDTVDEETRQCLEDAVTDERLKEFFVATMVDGADEAQSGGAGQDLMTALMACPMPGLGGSGTE